MPSGTLASEGPAKDCVIDKINQFATELADPKLGSAGRLLALKFLLNLVADIHQPLNVSIEEGNNHGLEGRMKAKTVTPGNLYHYWNESFVYELGTNPHEVAQQLIAHISAAIKSSGLRRAAALGTRGTSVGRGARLWRAIGW